MQLPEDKGWKFLFDHLSTVFLWVGLIWLVLTGIYQVWGKDALLIWLAEPKNTSQTLISTDEFSVAVTLHGPYNLPPCDSSFQTAAPFVWTLSGELTAVRSWDALDNPVALVYIVPAQNIVLKNGNGEPVTSLLALPGAERELSGRATFYACTIPGTNTGEKNEITIQVRSAVEHPQIRNINIPAKPMNSAAVILLNLLNLLLSNPLGGIAFFVWGLWEKIDTQRQEHQQLYAQKVQAFQQEIQDLRTLPIHFAVQHYSSLWKRASDNKGNFDAHTSDALKKLLRSIWRNRVRFQLTNEPNQEIVLYQLRQQALEMIREIIVSNEENKDAFNQWETTIQQWTESDIGFSSDDLDFLRERFSKYLEAGFSLQPGDEKAFAADMVRALVILGSPHLHASTESVLYKLVAKYIPDWTEDIKPPILKAFTAPQHGAVGWLLWTQGIRLKKTGNYQSEKSNYRPKAGTYPLWPASKKDSLNPFGPEQSEFDPRFPDLFFKSMPGWAEARRPEHTFLRASPGCGRTALIWMGRHRFRPWGVQGGENISEVAFSVYLYLNGKASQDELKRRFQDALGHGLLAVTAEDPSWLFNAPLDLQRDVLQFLVQWAGGRTKLQQRFQQCHVPYPPGEQTLPNAKTETPDDRLLHLLISETILSKSDAAIRISDLLPALRRALVPPARWNPPPTLPIYLWVDIDFPCRPGEWETVLLEWGDLWQETYLKIFSPFPLDSESYPWRLVRADLTWSAEQLNDLLAHRMEDIGGERWYEDAVYKNIASELRDQITAREVTTPRALVSHGNQLYERHKDKQQGGLTIDGEKL